MKIKCDNCGAVAETVKPESVRDGNIEHTFFRCPACGAVYPHLRVRYGAQSRHCGIQQETAADPRKACD